MLIDNQLGGSNVEDPKHGIPSAAGCFSAGTRAKDKAADRFYLVSMASSGPGAQVPHPSTVPPLFLRCSSTVPTLFTHSPHTDHRHADNIQPPHSPHSD